MTDAQSIEGKPEGQWPKEPPAELLLEGRYFLDEGHSNPEWAARAVRDSEVFSRECEKFMKNEIE
jgi:hypothetical protein